MSQPRALLFACLFLGACSGGSSGVGSASSSNEPTAELAGSWKGTWTSKTGVSGSMTIVMQQSGSTLDGDLHFSGSPCFANGHFAGSISGHDFSGSVTAGAIRVDMSGTVTGNAYDGTYDSVSAGACTGDTGTFTASR